MVYIRKKRRKYFITFNNQYDDIYKISQYFQYFSRNLTFNVLNGCLFLISFEAQSSQSSQKRKKKKML